MNVCPCDRSVLYSLMPIGLLSFLFTSLFCHVVEMAFHLDNGGLQLDNGGGAVSFIHTQSALSGGRLPNATLVNCSFMGNSAPFSGGAVAR